MYGLHSTRFTLNFVPYASKRIICNSWLGLDSFALDLNYALDLIIDNINDTVSPHCTKNKSLSINDEETKDTSNNNGVMIWSIDKHKDNRDGYDAILHLNSQVNNLIVPLPLIHTFFINFWKNRSSTNLSVNYEDLNKLSFGQLLFKITNDDSVNEQDVTDELTKSVAWRKKNVNTKLDGMMGKLEKRSAFNVDKKYNYKENLSLSHQFCTKKSKESVDKEEDECEDMKKPSKDAEEKKESYFSDLNEVKQSNRKKESGTKSAKFGTTLASIEKKLPVWQNKIADFLQSLQDLVFKSKRSSSKERKKDSDDKFD